MRVLVTGATGYLGWRTATLLRERGHEVVALTRPGHARARRRADLDVDRARRRRPGGARARRGLRRGPALRRRARPRARARATPRRAVRENAGTTLNLLEGCAEHDALLVYPSHRARGSTRRRPVRALQAPRRGGLPAAPGAQRGRAALDVDLRPRPGRVGGRDGRDRRVRRPRARRAADRDPRRPAAARATSSTSTTSSTGSSALAADGAASRAAVGRAAASPPRSWTRRGSSSRPPGPASRSTLPGGELPPGEDDSYALPPGAPRLALTATAAATRRSPRMSTGSASIPLLKAAPEPEQVAERLEGGPWAGMELALLPRHVADDAALDRAIARGHRRRPRTGIALLAEAPVSWPSGDHVRVDRLDDEARDGHRAQRAVRRGDRLAGPHDPPLHPADAGRAARGRPVDEDAVARVPRFFARGVREPRRHAADRERPARPAHAHGRRLLHADRRALARPAALARARPGARLHARHLARRAVPLVRRRVPVAVRAGRRRGARARALRRGARAGRRGRARLQRGRRPRRGAATTTQGELDLDPVVARLGELVPYVVAEINEPDHSVSPNMKAGYRRDRPRAARAPPSAGGRRRGGCRPRRSTGRPSLGRRDPVPDVLGLADAARGAARPRHRRRRLDRPVAHGAARGVPARAHHRRSTRTRRRSPPTATRRAPRASRASSTCCATCATASASRTRPPARRPDVVFHLAAYKHVDWAERYPEEFAATNLDGSWNVLRAAEAAGAETVVVASTDKAARATNLYGRTKRLMEGADVAGRRALGRGPRRGAARQRARQRGQRDRAVAAPGARRRAAHADRPDDGPLLDHDGPRGVARRARRARRRRGRAAASPPPTRSRLDVGELAERIWREAGARRAGAAHRRRAAGRDDDRGARRARARTSAARCSRAPRRSTGARPTDDVARGRRRGRAQRRAPRSAGACGSRDAPAPPASKGSGLALPLRAR